MLGTVYHTGYLTDDADRAVEFYRTTFGGQVIRQTTGPTGDKMVFLKIGGSEVEVIEPADRSRLGGRTGLIIDHVGYYVEDFDRAMSELAAKGIRFATPAPTGGPGHRMIYLDAATTLGTRIHINEAPKAR